MSTVKNRFLYCFLREKQTTLQVIEADDGGRSYVCLERDAECSARKCKLSEYGSDRPGEAKDPWFNE